MAAHCEVPPVPRVTQLATAFLELCASQLIETHSGRLINYNFRIFPVNGTEIHTNSIQHTHAPESTVGPMRVSVSTSVENGEQSVLFVQPFIEQHVCHCVEGHSHHRYCRSSVRIAAIQSQHTYLYRISRLIIIIPELRKHEFSTVSCFFKTY